MSKKLTFKEAMRTGKPCRVFYPKEGVYDENYLQLINGRITWKTKEGAFDEYFFSTKLFDCEYEVVSESKTLSSEEIERVIKLVHPKLERVNVILRELGFKNV